MCEYLRPVVALEWLKALLYRHGQWMSSLIQLGRNTEHDDSTGTGTVMAITKLVEHYPALEIG